MAKMLISQLAKGEDYSCLNRTVTILDNLSEIGNVPQNLIDCINKQNNLNVLKSWNKISVMAESLGEFEEKIK